MISRWILWWRFDPMQAVSSLAGVWRRTITLPRWRLLACWVAWLSCSPSALALDGAAEALQSGPQDRGHRLSEWVLKAAGPLADTTALHWRADAQRVEQAGLKRALLEDLVRMRTVAPDDTAPWLRQWDWMLARPLTGRVRLTAADPRVLQAQPENDPVLGSGDRAVLFPRPAYVSVWSTSGVWCQVPHVAHMGTADYLKACTPQAATWVSRAWVVQPNGLIQATDVGPWNASGRIHPRPGAWVWAPEDSEHVPDAVSIRMAELLALQPPLEVLLSEHGAPPKAFGQWRLSANGGGLRGIDQGQLAVTANDWGESGYFQTPSARMMPAGGARIHYSLVEPYRRVSVMLQPFDWLAAGFRYSDEANTAYGVSTTGQSNKDKSFDLRLRLAQEGRIQPQVALGLRDLGGTGLFASEYVVASKRWRRWDTSLGLGWGYLANRQNWGNPLSVLGSRWEQRQHAAVGKGGTPGVGAWFTGPVSPFVGIQYTASARWAFKAEWDPNNYTSEPHETIRSDSPWNWGLVFRQNEHVDWTLGRERGNRWMLGLSLHGGPNGLAQLTTPKALDPGVPPANTLKEASPQALAKAIQQATGWEWVHMQVRQHQAELVLEVGNEVFVDARVQKVIGLAHVSLPAEVRTLSLQLQQHGLGLRRIEVDRYEWALQKQRALPSALRLRTATDLPPRGQSGLRIQSLSWRVVPEFKQVIGGPDAFVLYQWDASAQLEYRWRPSTWMSGKLNVRAFDNYGSFHYDAPSNLPRVRTDQRRYLTTSPVALDRLQLTHMSEWGGGWYSSVYGGWLESMFGGLGAEVLYSPWRKNWSVGLDLNHVWQRRFAQDFGFSDYAVNTGHLAWHWQTGIADVDATWRVGRYLAGDWGTTLDLSRSFQNGVRFGAWLTRTQASSQDFGEGSFDKGIYIEMPFDVISPRSLGGLARLSWTPLTRDGGASLTRAYPLHQVLRARQEGNWSIRDALPVPPRSGDALGSAAPPQSRDSAQLNAPAATGW